MGEWRARVWQPSCDRKTVGTLGARRKRLPSYACLTPRLYGRFSERAWLIMSGWPLGSMQQVRLRDLGGQTPHVLAKKPYDRPQTGTVRFQLAWLLHIRIGMQQIGLTDIFLGS